MLGSNAPRQGSPFSRPQVAGAASSQNTNGSTADDDWNFTSALPEDSLPYATSVVVSDKEVAINFDVSRRTNGEPILDIVAKFSNKTATPITEYTFQVAVTKVMRTLHFL